MKTSEVLAKAAEIQAEHGHCKGDMKTEDGRTCLQGALCEAIGVKWVPDGTKWRPTATGEQYDQLCAANDTVMLHLRTTGMVSFDGRAYEWNDRSSTTGEDVILVLKHSAELAREQEEAEGV
jgi:hypothetical protein